VQTGFFYLITFFFLFSGGLKCAFLIVLVCRLTTLGSGEASGSLYVLSLKKGPEIQDWDRNYPLPFQIQSRVKTRGSIWTAEASPNGITASLGTGLLYTCDVHCTVYLIPCFKGMHSSHHVKTTPCI
jgi:hypothetical protein